MMKMYDGGTQHFAVIYADGDKEVNVGTIAVDPASVSFKRLLSVLSHKIGIPPHSFSVFLAAVGTDRKIPLTAKVNLTAAIFNDDAAASCYFLIVKRSSSSRRSKKAAAAAAAAAAVHSSPSLSGRKTPPDNVMLLRRSAGESQLAAYRVAAPPFVDRVEFERRMMNLRIERERFLMNMAVNEGNNIGREASNGGASLSNVIYGSGGRVARGSICVECMRAAATTTTGTKDLGFHPCIYDEITVGFRTSAGPISRPPAKNSSENCS